MAALPYMPLYVADYLADTAHLTTEEHGAYLLLIMNYWQRGKALPGDPQRLARIAGLSNERWTDVERTLNEFFEPRDGLWFHARIETELRRVREKSEKAKRAGMASVKARALTDVQRTFNGRSTDAEQTFNHTDTDTDTEKKETRASAREDFGEKFWLEYPHPPNRGGKSTVVRKINGLPESDRQAAFASLERFRAVIAEQRKKIPDYAPPMAQTFVNQRRWEGLEPVPREKLAPIPPPDDPQARTVLDWIVRRFGEPAARSWFCAADGLPFIRMNCSAVVIAPPSGVYADRIRSQYWPAIRRQFGDGVRLEEPG